MLDLITLDAKPFTLLLNGTTPEGEDDWAVFADVARVQDGRLYLDRGEKPRFEIRQAWTERIRPVDPATRTVLLDADYYLPVSIGSVPVGGDSSNFLETGLKWPD